MQKHQVAELFWLRSRLCTTDFNINMTTTPIDIPANIPVTLKLYPIDRYLLVIYENPDSIRTDKYTETNIALHIIISSSILCSF